jgi:hypothetical protein
VVRVDQSSRHPGGLNDLINSGCRRYRRRSFKDIPSALDETV